METPHFVADAPGAPAGVAPGAQDDRVRLRGAALASVLASLMLTLFLAALDQTIVNTALPKILRDINGYDRYTWPIIAYLLTSTTMIPIVGKLSDQFGRKWFLIPGVVVFLVGSALCGASKEFASIFNGDPMNFFIAFRGLQGIGGGILLGLVFTLVGDIFTPAERARWQGLFTAVFGLSSVIGPTAGGYITDNLGWQWIFYINLPLGIVALFLLTRFLPNNLSVRTTVQRGWAGIRRIDFLGAFTAAGATVCLVLGLNWGGGTPPNGYPWDSTQVVGALSAAGALLIIFLLIERFVAREPILPLDLFKNRVFTAGALLSLGVGMALFAVVLYLPLFLQDILGNSATESGLLATPLTLTMAFLAAIGGQLVARVGRYQWLAVLGALVLTGGIFLMTRLSNTSDINEVIRDMIVVGAGMGMIFPVLTLAVQNAIPRQRLGAGTGAVTYIRSMGQLFGVAAVGSVATNGFSDALNQRLPAGVSQLPADARSQLLNPTILQQVLGDPARQAQAIQLAQGNADATVVPGIVQQQAPAIIQQQLPAAIRAATATIPPGPNHAAQVAAATQQVTAQVTQQVTAQVTQQVTAQVNGQIADTLHQLFSASRDALTIGIQHAFVVGVIVAAVVFLVSLFLKDVPLGQRAPAVAGQLVRNTELNEAATFSGEALPGAAFASTGGAGAMAIQQRPAYAPMPAYAAAQGTAQTPAAQPQNIEALTWGALGLTLATLARAAELSQADPRLLAALSDAVDGRYPHDWSPQERGQAVAREMVQPLAQALLAAYVDSADPSAPSVATMNGHSGAGNGYAVGQGYAANGHANGSGYRDGFIDGNAARAGHNGAGANGAGSNGANGAYPQPWMAPAAMADTYPASEYPTMTPPRKKVRVTRRLVVDGQVIGEQSLENLVPLDADTETAAAELRARLDAASLQTSPVESLTERLAEAPTLQRIPLAPQGSEDPTRHIR